MIKALICGINGKMGQTVKRFIENTDGIGAIAGVDKMPDVIENDFPVYAEIGKVREKADVIIDFSRPDALAYILDYAQKSGIAVVLATTGYDIGQKKQIEEASKKIPVFFSANMSLGVNLQMNLSKTAAEFLGSTYDIEIIEKHHNQKVDAPSGTALAIADHINTAFAPGKKYVYGRTPKSGKRDEDEIGIHAIRGGTVVGEHEVMFFGDDEIISVRHSALSKQVFAQGAVRAAKFITKKAPGLYSMKDMIAESNVVTKLSFQDSEAIATLLNVSYDPKSVAHIFEVLGENDVNIDIISQTTPKDGRIDISFSIEKADVGKVRSILEKSSGATKYVIEESISRITIEGMGMAQESGVAARFFSALATENIKVVLLSTSSTKISCCINSTDSKGAILALTQAFNL